MKKSMPYQAEREELFTTETGLKAMLWSGTVVSRLGKTFTTEEFGKAMVPFVFLQPWMTLNLLDHLVEQGMIRELTGSCVAGQHRCFQSNEFTLEASTFRGQRWLLMHSVLTYLYAFAEQYDAIDEPEAAGALRNAAERLGTSERT